MAKLTAFMIGESSQNINRPNGAPSGQQLTGLSLALRPQFIPGNFSFVLSIGISDIDLSKENKLQLVFLAPSGAVVQDFGETALPIINELDTMPKEYRGFIATIDFRNTPIHEEGCYSFEVFVNSEKIGSANVPIFKGKGVDVK